ncbi:MAG: dihydrolipoamide acetyltransferase family protein [Pseudomonadota bacterium]
MQVLSVKLPDVGEGVTEAELAEWHVRIGDIVREDDVLAAVMTDKATVEIPSIYSGKVVWIGGELGDRLPVGADLVRIETDDSEIATPSGEAEGPRPEPQSAVPPADREPVKTPPATTSPSVTDQPAKRSGGQAPLASPATRARAREAGVDLRQVPGSGPAGRITPEDLNRFLTNPSAVTARTEGSQARRSGVEEIRVIGLRRKIAERMSLANAKIPHITVVEEVDVTALEDLRAKLNETRGDKPKLTMLPLLSAALCRTVEDHPEMNAHYLDEDQKIKRYAAVHIGIATMTQAGLMVPVLRHAESLGLFDIASEIARLSEAARAATAAREELSGSTITITSLGPLGALATTPIINAPEVAILGVNKIAMRPHWDGEQFVPRKMMNLSASFDHRVIDGWDAAVFVQRLKSLLETPAMIFVEV